MIRKLLFVISALILIARTLQLSAQDKAEKIDEFIQKMVEYDSFTGSALVVDNGDVIFKKVIPSPTVNGISKTQRIQNYNSIGRQSA